MHTLLQASIHQQTRRTSFPLWVIVLFASLSHVFGVCSLHVCRSGDASTRRWLGSLQRRGSLAWRPCTSLILLRSKTRHAHCRRALRYSRACLPYHTECPWTYGPQLKRSVHCKGLVPSYPERTFLHKSQPLTANFVSRRVSVCVPVRVSVCCCVYMRVARG